jgi:hypothetical protein
VFPAISPILPCKKLSQFDDLLDWGKSTYVAKERLVKRELRVIIGNLSCTYYGEWARKNNGKSIPEGRCAVEREDRKWIFGYVKDNKWVDGTT